MKIANYVERERKKTIRMRMKMNENECFFLPKKIVFFSVCMCNDDDDDEKIKE